MITMLRSLDRISSIDSEGRLLHYLTIIIRNKIIDLRRRNMRRESILTAEDPALVAPNELTQLEVNEQLELIREAIKKLSDRERLVFEHRIAGETLRQTAESMGCSVGTVAMLAHKAQQHLKDFLREKGVVE
jgi:RNA polymerase sigma factor (sigma-70 family)